MEDHTNHLKYIILHHRTATLIEAAACLLLDQQNMAQARVHSCCLQMALSTRWCL